MIEVTIIGAGVAGLFAAHELARRGAQVRILDRNGAPGPHGCSWWAGGMLAPECEGATAEPVITRLGREAAEAWSRITPVTHRGTLVIALQRDRSELDRFARRTTGARRLDAQGIATLEPDLDHREGLFFPSEAHLDPRVALSDLLADLSSRGITVERSQTPPENLSGIVIDARGMEAPGLRGVRGEMVVIRTPEITLTRPVRLLHPRHPLYVVPRGDGRLMLGATQLESAARGAIRVRSLLELLSAAYALDPRLAEAELVETGADLRPAYPDNIPRVTRTGRILRLNGLFRHGFLLAPALARQAADLLLNDIKGELVHED
ncbi:FAD-dependent oxidoreductase [Paracoccus sp. 1_MG-2023]|uniref:FAD-dependent oxidoreductase n=1 Tax=unclassified Paracoccus (in: a-proteobacteria) TaxID=2688777 RepID=UPI001C087CBE|nr:MULTISPECIES: FAD-dependent oxidoreductase [unclassified Paracoccus (in: a-proteobacteria)]MBU2956571.1 FAD-dependent oxidoreductase [Paracoccus sp. C2R09]MDO6668677.1 FAD-dependent oxidoreductase [Paracoccus sp. 1_MG-2023]